MAPKKRSMQTNGFFFPIIAILLAGGVVGADGRHALSSIDRMAGIAEPGPTITGPAQAGNVETDQQCRARLSKIRGADLNGCGNGANASLDPSLAQVPRQRH